MIHPFIPIKNNNLLVVKIKNVFKYFDFVCDSIIKSLKLLELTFFLKIILYF